MSSVIRRNKHQVRCEYCGHIIPPGEGRIWRCFGALTGHCPQHGKLAEGGWHVICWDITRCRRRVTRQTKLATKIRVRASRASRARGEQEDLFPEPSRRTD